MPFADSELSSVLTLDLFLVAGFGAVVLLARMLFWPRRPEPGQRLPLSAATLILAGAIALPLAWNWLAETWPTLDATMRADAMAVFHLGFVVAVLALQLLILVGWPLGWAWVRNFWLRLLHLLAILLVAGQGAVNLSCPFTIWERELREGDLSNLEKASDLGRFCNRMLYRPADEPRALVWRYLAVGGILAGTWFLVRPRLPGTTEEKP